VATPQSVFHFFGLCINHVFDAKVDGLAARQLGLPGGKAFGNQFCAEQNGGGGTRQENRESPSADTLQKLPGKPGQGR